MDVVVRTYTGKGSKELLSLLEKHKTDLEKIMRSVKGFESYTLARSSEGDGGMSMTVCQGQGRHRRERSHCEGMDLEECCKHQYGWAESLIGHHHRSRHKALISCVPGPAEHSDGRVSLVCKNRLSKADV